MNSNAVIFLYSQSVPEIWNSCVSDIIRRSQAERSASRQLRERIAKVIAHVSRKLSDMWNEVNAALARRIREVTDARNQLQASLGKVSEATLILSLNVYFDLGR